MLCVILIVRAHHAQRLVVIEAIVKQSLSVHHAEVLGGELQVCFGQQPEHSVALVLRVREVNVEALAAEK